MKVGFWLYGIGRMVITIVVIGDYGIFSQKLPLVIKLMEDIKLPQVMKDET